MIGRISKVAGYYRLITDDKTSIWFNPLRIEAKFDYSLIRVILDNVDNATPVFQFGAMDNRSECKLTRSHTLELEFHHE